MSILTDTKKILGIAEDYTVFDLDILTHINSTLSILSQLGIGSVEGFFVEDATNDWDELLLESHQLLMLKSYLYLKVRLLFDPPTTSYLIEAMNKQIQEFEWRLNSSYELLLPLPVVEDVDV